jgi:hypothetical protein
MVGVNVPIPVPMAFYSFGGWKASLFGDTHGTAPRACTSTPAARPSRPAGWTPVTAAQPGLPAQPVGKPQRTSGLGCLCSGDGNTERAAQARDGHRLGGHGGRRQGTGRLRRSFPLLLGVLVWPGAPIAVTAMATALVLACLFRRWYGEAALVAVSVRWRRPSADGAQGLIGRTSRGDPSSQRTRHQGGRLGHGPSAAACHDACEDAPLLASCPGFHGILDSRRGRVWG